MVLLKTMKPMKVYPDGYGIYVHKLAIYYSSFLVVLMASPWHGLS